MTTLQAQPSRPRWWQHPLLRMVAASLAVVLPLALSMALMEALVPKVWRIAWPNAVGLLACGLGYVLFVRHIERRPVQELAATGALQEGLRYAALGMGLGLVCLAPLWAVGAYTVTGMGSAWPLLKSVPAMALVAGLEELLMRGVLFRMAHAAWGTRIAMGLTTVAFVAGHLPGSQIGWLGVAVTAAASVAFTAAYLRTGRLWAPIGLHFGWNYLFDAVFSVPVSGHEVNGWLQATLSGPAWLSGGAYGVEGSLGALLVWSLLALAWLRPRGGVPYQRRGPVSG